MKRLDIRTLRLVLTPLGPQHLMSTHAYAADPENTRLMMFLPHETLEETRQFIEDSVREWQKPDPGYYEYAILRGGEHIGGLTLYMEYGPETAELGWVLHPDHQGHGYAVEAAAALMDAAREQMGIRRFIAQCDAENLPSQAVMRRLGMTLVDDTGTRRNRGSDEVRRELRYEVGGEQEIRE